MKKVKLILSDPKKPVDLELLNQKDGVSTFIEPSTGICVIIEEKESKNRDALNELSEGRSFTWQINALERMLKRKERECNKLLITLASIHLPETEEIRRSVFEELTPSQKTWVILIGRFSDELVQRGIITQNQRNEMSKYMAEKMEKAHDEAAREVFIIHYMVDIVSKDPEDYIMTKEITANNELEAMKAFVKLATKGNHPKFVDSFDGSPKEFKEKLLTLNIVIDKVTKK